MDIRPTPQPGEIYRHFKGHYAVIISIANHTETNEELVIYECFNSDGSHKTYARPIEMFMSAVDKEKYPDARQFYRLERVREISCLLRDSVPGELFEFALKHAIPASSFVLYDAFMKKGLDDSNR